MKEQMIMELESYAIINGWSASMYEIVEHDIKNGVFETMEDLKKYIEQ